MPQERHLEGFDPSVQEVTLKDIRNAQLLLRRIDLLTEYTNSDDRVGRFSDLIDSGAYPIIYSNHTHHLNIAAFSRIWDALDVRPQKAYVIVAHSLTAGKQTPDLARRSNAIKKLLASNNLHFLEVARPKDIEEYRQSGVVEEEIKRAQRQSAESMRTVLESISDNEGLFVFPAGTTEEAVLDKDGVRPGMLEVRTPIMPHVLERAMRKGREVALLPVGNANTFRIAEPRGTSPTISAKLGIGMDMLGFVPNKLAKVVIGEPYTLSEMATEGTDLRASNEVNDYVMGKVAMLLPPEARGYYK